MKFDFKQSFVEHNSYYVICDESFTVYDFIKCLESEPNDAYIKIDMINHYNMECGFLQNDIHENLLSKKVLRITVDYSTIYPTYHITTEVKRITQNVINEAIDYYLTKNDAFLKYINSIYKKTHEYGHIEGVQKIEFENNEPVLYCNWVDDEDCGTWGINVKDLKL